MKKFNGLDTCCPSTHGGETEICEKKTDKSVAFDVKCDVTGLKPAQFSVPLYLD